ncbi:MAG: hypothetical protein M1823_005744 [Watsoniomyces obsoletus]|nr:MAG: hypothetical protein M1823_005744 [Watsoniomyces obsoletus]
MDDAEAALQQQLPVALRHLHHHHPHVHHHHAHAHHGATGLGTALGASDLDALDPTADTFPSSLPVGLTHGHTLQAVNVFDTNGHGAFDDTRASATSHHPNGAGLGMLTSVHALTGSGAVPHDALGRLPSDEDLFAPPDDGTQQQDTDLSVLQAAIEPPDLAAWRQRLFDVNEMITMTEEQYVESSGFEMIGALAERMIVTRFHTYFPYVDNVYSHRSTQRYKRKPFVSHYWDCRLKGRPPGTPKSDDPNKKKRKRVARQRDLCDVKIKITEYAAGQALDHGGFSMAPPSASLDPESPTGFFASGQASSAFGVLTPTSAFPPGHPALTGNKYYTIQRVNGNGGNGKADGVPGPHQHTLADSDRIKKSSVLRGMMKEDKVRKKSQVGFDGVCFSRAHHMPFIPSSKGQGSSIFSDKHMTSSA